MFILGIFFFAAILRNTDLKEIFRQHNTVSSYCNNPASNQNRFLLIITASIGYSLTALVVAADYSHSNYCFDPPIRATSVIKIIVSYLFMFVGIFYTKAVREKSHKDYDICGTCHKYNLEELEIKNRRNTRKSRDTSSRNSTPEKGKNHEGQDSIEFNSKSPHNGDCCFGHRCCCCCRSINQNLQVKFPLGPCSMPLAYSEIIHSFLALLFFITWPILSLVYCVYEKTDNGTACLPLAISNLIVLVAFLASQVFIRLAYPKSPPVSEYCSLLQKMIRWYISYCQERKIFEKYQHTIHLVSFILEALLVFFTVIVASLVTFDEHEDICVHL